MATRREIACHDIVPGCDFVTSAPTDEELLAKVAHHAAHAHGLKEVSPELLGKVKGAIHDAD
jgi:predicted small metal-binding protein